MFAGRSAAGEIVNESADVVKTGTSTIGITFYGGVVGWGGLLDLTPLIPLTDVDYPSSAEQGIAWISSNEQRGQQPSRDFEI